MHKNLTRFVTLEFAERMYKETGIAQIVNDGKHITLEKEPTRSPAK